MPRRKRMTKTVPRLPAPWAQVITLCSLALLGPVRRLQGKVSGLTEISFPRSPPGLL